MIRLLLALALLVSGCSNHQPAPAVTTVPRFPPRAYGIPVAHMGPWDVHGEYEYCPFEGEQYQIWAEFEADWEEAQEREE